MHLNTKTNNLDCGKTTSPYSKDCLCWTEGACSNTDGTVANPSKCMCGYRICWSANQLCNSADNLCFDPDTCTDTNGQSKNTKACKCGTAICSSAHFCNSADNFCFNTCTDTNGQAKNTESCKCGATSVCEPNSLCDRTNNDFFCSKCVPCRTGTRYGTPRQNGQCCLACTPGRYSSTISSTCLACNKGLYAPDLSPQPFGASKCSPCTVGQYAPSANADACLVCPRGKYQTKTGMGNCTGCPAGKKLSTVGTYQEHDSLKDCEDCAILRFSPFEGHFEECYPCLSARTVGSVECAGCDPGTYKTENDDCAQCPSGYFTSKQNLKRCDDCPSGYFANQMLDGTIRYDRCQACQRGQHGTIPKSKNEQEGCSNCTSGKYSDVEGLKLPIGCKGCPKGKWSYFASCLNGLFLVSI